MTSYHRCISNIWGQSRIKHGIQKEAKSPLQKEGELMSETKQLIGQNISAGGFVEA